MTLWWEFDCYSIFIVSKIIGHFLQIISSTQWSWWSMKNQLDMEQPQVLSLLTSTGKQFAVISLIHNNQMSQTLLWRAPGPSPLSVYFFSITCLPGLALIVVWTLPKLQVTMHTITKQFILILWVQGRVSAPSPGEGVLLSLDQVTQTLSVGTVWKRRGEKNSIPPTDSDWWVECTHSQLARIGLIGDTEVLWR